MAISPPIIRAQGVTKRFGNFVALRDMDLELTKGECVGLLGPNGAGKSTFIGCIYGVVRRTAGTLEVFGHDPNTGARQIKQNLGVVPQENALDEELTVRENMELYARFGGLSRTTARKRIDELLTHMALEHKGDATIKMLSGGMKRRLTLSEPSWPIPNCSFSTNPPRDLIPRSVICSGKKSMPFAIPGRLSWSPPTTCMRQKSFATVSSFWTAGRWWDVDPRKH